MFTKLERLSTFGSNENNLLKKFALFSMSVLICGGELNVFLFDNFNPISINL